MKTNQILPLSGHKIELKGSVISVRTTTLNYNNQIHICYQIFLDEKLVKTFDSKLYNEGSNPAKMTGFVLNILRTAVLNFVENSQQIAKYNRDYFQIMKKVQSTI